MVDPRKIAELKRQDWTQAKARGKYQFILRRGLLPTIVIWFGISLPLPFVERNGPWSLLQVLAIDLITLPIFLLGGYLQGVWKWKELEKKYPE
jgi:hypothetical protein